MYNIAPRALAGVSVYYGDNITQRSATGEVVFFLGQAQKGPRTPIIVTDIINSINLYGTESALTKAAYQFWDGYVDSPRSIPLQLVFLRVGGIPAYLTTPLGIEIETTDAYTDIENQFYVYVNNATLKSARVIKVWNLNKQKVYEGRYTELLDSRTGTSTSVFSAIIDTGHIIVTGELDGVTNTYYGKDLDQDPFDIPATLKSLLGTEMIAADKTQGTLTGDGSAYDGVSANTYRTDTDTTALSLYIDAASQGDISSTGWIIIKSKLSSITTTTMYEYTEVATNMNTGIATFIISGVVNIDGSPNDITVGVSKYSLVVGDSQTTSDPRKKYELFRNALLEIEQYTPDYVVPGGISFNETDVYSRSYTYNTYLTEQHSYADDTIKVDGAALWSASGNVDLYNGTFTDQLVYDSLAPSGYDFTLHLDLPSGIEVTACSTAVTATSTKGTITVKAETGLTDEAGNAVLAKFRQSGILQHDSGIDPANSPNLYRYKYTSVTYDTANVTATFTIDDSTPVAGIDISRNDTISKVPLETGTSYAGVMATHTFSVMENRKLGIGYVKETDVNGLYEFTWYDNPTPGANLAHFGYLLANYCNDASVNYNTPICGMNVDTTVLQTLNYTRASIISWMGKFPVYGYAGGSSTDVSYIAENGTGLLGDPVVAGATIESYGDIPYNRTNLNDESNAIYVDPAYGLLLTYEGFIDGNIVIDSFYNTVDLGKFMVVGAGLLTFNHRASATTYVDTCGLYSLGMLAGKPKNEGISYSKIGVNSNVQVGVVVYRKYYNDLASMKYIVVSREKGLGWVLNNGDSISRNDSEYKLISTTRILKYVVEDKRAELNAFISKPLTTFVYEAARTRIAERLRKDFDNGLLNGGSYDLQIEEAGTAIGKLYLRLSLNPPKEIKEITIDTIIDRTLVGVK